MSKVSTMLMLAFALLQLPAWTNATSPYPAVVKTDPMADQRRAAKLLDAARKAMSQGDKDLAIDRTELAVRELPRDAGSRMLLGRAYLAAGRFASAETAFGDALALDPTLTRAAINRALAQIALGNKAGALASLDQAGTAGNEADVGLALALMGEVDRARPLLEAAAHAPGAEPRARQNLALFHALQGHWNDAAVVAAQDVPADQVADRLRRWAMIVQMKGQPAMQVGALLGILPGNDPGQPVALALASPPPADVAAPVAVAEAVPVATPEAVPAKDSLKLADATPAAITLPIVEARNAAYSGPPRMRSARPAIHHVRTTQTIQVSVAALVRRPANLVRAGKPRAVAVAVRSSQAKAKLRLANSCIVVGPKLQLGKGRIYRIAFDGSPIIPRASRHCVKGKGKHCAVRTASRAYRPMRVSKPINT